MPNVQLYTKNKNTRSYIASNQENNECNITINSKRATGITNFKTRSKLVSTAISNVKTRVPDIQDIRCIEHWQYYTLRNSQVFTKALCDSRLKRNEFRDKIKSQVMHRDEKVH